MKWIPTNAGAVNARYVLKLERDSSGSVLHLTNGTTVKSSLQFEVIDGELQTVELDDDDADIPF